MIFAQKVLAPAWHPVEGYIQGVGFTAMRYALCAMRL